MFDKIRHVVWDWNGTLYNDVDAALLSINTMLAERDLPVMDRMRYREVFGFPVIDCYREIGFEFSSESEWDSIANEFHSHYNRHAETSSLSDGVVDVLGTLKERDIQMSVLSAAKTSTLLASLDRYGIAGYFGDVFGLDDLYGASKIDLGRKLLAKIGVDPIELLLVGDTTHDHEVARDLGCSCILYLDGHQDRDRLTKCGCAVISSFKEMR
jgi:phosphoglycolate phosphatase